MESSNPDKVYSLNINDILPSQLFISRSKFNHWQEMLGDSHSKEYPPVPIKRIGNDKFFTDGHTRALVHLMQGAKTINVYDDTDDLDWIAYLADLAQCRSQRVTSIADLETRIIDEGDFKIQWLDRCKTKQTDLARDPLRGLTIRFEERAERKQAICDDILHALPEWFGIEEAIVEYVDTVTDLPFIELSLYGKVVGFCALKLNHQINLELYVLGIFREFRGRGLGKKLLTFIEDYSKDLSIPYLTVKTLSASHPDPNYRDTRIFYESVGFKPFEEFPSLWGTNNPCLYMLKKV